MHEFLMSHGDDLVVFGFILVALAMVLTTLVVSLVQWRKVRQAEIDGHAHKAELEVFLKHDLLNRGMSADEIRRVLEASAGGPSDPSRYAAQAAEAFQRAQADGDWKKAWADFGKTWGEFGKVWQDAARKHAWRGRCGG